jgi:hypothetical protein
MKKILSFLGALFSPFKYISSRKVSGKLEDFFVKRPYMAYILAIFVTIIILVGIFIVPQLFPSESITTVQDIIL